MLHREISHKRFQIDALDGLRGFAALLVVLSHTSNEGMHLIPFLDFRGTGKSGVFLFFLLSSFLLTLPLLAKEDRKERILSMPVMSNYWTRRFLRVYPLYTLYLIAALVSTWVMGRFLNMPDLGVPFLLRVDEFFKHLLLVQGKGVTWSIAVEFKFYFILPLLVIFVSKTRRHGLGAVTLLFAVGLAACLWAWPPSESLSNDIRLRPYLPIFLTGIYLAVLQEHIQNRGVHAERLVKAIRLLTLPAIAVLLAMTPSVLEWVTNSEVAHDAFHRQFLTFAACWAVLLMAAIHSNDWIAGFFDLRILRSLGALSFSLYLFHMPLISALKRVEWPGIIEGWLVFLLSLGASWLSFRLIEGPISRIRVNKGAPGGRLRFIRS